MTINQWLRRAVEALQKASVPSDRLDAELILADVLNRDRVYLHAHGDLLLSTADILGAKAKLQQRQKRVPLAYILGHKEFYGRDFVVTPAVLVPRPETETLIEVIERLALSSDAVIADVGTGSGAIGITLQLNQPARHVIATDVSPEALAVARANAKHLGARVVFREGDLLEPLLEPVDLIVANLPYVDHAWNRSPETDHEPSLALFAADHGLALINRLMPQTAARLKWRGYAVLEADPGQHQAIIASAQEHSLRHISTEGYGLLFQC